MTPVLAGGIWEEEEEIDVGMGVQREPEGESVMT